MFVERSGGRAKCQICGIAIARGMLRTVEETPYQRRRDSYEDDDRVHRTYCHLTCAVEVKRELAYQALIARASPSDLVDEALLELADAKLAAEVRAFREREYPRVEKRAVALDDPRTEELLRELEAAPHDRALYAVLADHLQQRGDERGELIILDLGVSDDPAAFARRRELAAALSPKLPPGAAKWGIGFLRKLELSLDRLDEIAPILTHPACRLLESIKLQAHGRPLAIPPGVLPRSLRHVDVIAQLLPAPAFAELPYLETLDVTGGVDLAHPTLRSLAIRSGTADFVAACATSCPAVTTLTVGQLADGLDAVLRTSWLARLTDLKVYGVEMSSRDVERLERALAGRKLARLSLSGSGLDESFAPRLQALCDHLEFGFALGYRLESQGPKYVEHTAKPEWGRGTIVREADGKVEVEFEKTTKKIFKAGAPFLKRL